MGEVLLAHPMMRDPGSSASLRYLRHDFTVSHSEYHHGSDGPVPSQFFSFSFEDVFILFLYVYGILPARIGYTYQCMPSATDPLVLESKTVVGCCGGVLGIEPRSSGGAASTLS